MGPSVELTGSKFLGKRFTLRGIKERFSIVGSKAILSITREINEGEPVSKPKEQLAVPQEHFSAPQEQPAPANARSSLAIQQEIKQRLTKYRDSAINHMVFYLNQSPTNKMNQEAIKKLEQNKIIPHMIASQAIEEDIDDRRIPRDPNDPAQIKKFDFKSVLKVSTDDCNNEPMPAARPVETPNSSRMSESNPYMAANILTQDIDIVELTNLGKNELKEIVDLTMEEKKAHARRISHLDKRMAAIQRILGNSDTLNSARDKQEAPASPEGEDIKQPESGGLVDKDNKRKVREVASMAQALKEALERAFENSSPRLTSSKFNAALQKIKSACPELMGLLDDILLVMPKSKLWDSPESVDVPEPQSVRLKVPLNRARSHDQFYTQEDKFNNVSVKPLNLMPVDEMKRAEEETPVKQDPSKVQTPEAKHEDSAKPTEIPKGVLKFSGPKNYELEQPTTKHLEKGRLATKYQRLALIEETENMESSTTSLNRLELHADLQLQADADHDPSETRGVRIGSSMIESTSLTQDGPRFRILDACLERQERFKKSKIASSTELIERHEQKVLTDTAHSRDKRPATQVRNQKVVIRSNRDGKSNKLAKGFSFKTPPIPLKLSLPNKSNRQQKSANQWTSESNEISIVQERSPSRNESQLAANVYTALDHAHSDGFSAADGIENDLGTRPSVVEAKKDHVEQRDHSTSLRNTNFTENAFSTGWRTLRPGSRPGPGRVNRNRKNKSGSRAEENSTMVEEPVQEIEASQLTHTDHSLEPRRVEPPRYHPRSVERPAEDILEMVGQKGVRTRTLYRKNVYQDAGEKLNHAERSKYKRMLEEMPTSKKLRYTDEKTVSPYVSRR